MLEKLPYRVTCHLHYDGGNAHVDHLVFLKTLRTTGLPVRNTPLINIPKGFSTEMTLEVA